MGKRRATDADAGVHGGPSSSRKRLHTTDIDVGLILNEKGEPTNVFCHAREPCPELDDAVHAAFAWRKDASLHRLPSQRGSYYSLSLLMLPDLLQALMQAGLHAVSEDGSVPLDEGSNDGDGGSDGGVDRSSPAQRLHHAAQADVVELDDDDDSDDDSDSDDETDSDLSSESDSEAAEAPSVSTPAQPRPVRALTGTVARVVAAVGQRVWDHLYPYQRDGVVAMVERRKTLLADEMGLGKTVQALVAAAVLMAENGWPLLIVCPTSLKLVWTEAIQTWLPPARRPGEGDLWVLAKGADIRKAKAKHGGRVPSDGPHICITTYDLARKLDGLQVHYKVVICDESHMLKSRVTQRSTFMGRVVRAAQAAILITGTPITSRPIDAWNQVDMLKPGLLGTYDKYGMRYCLAEGASASGRLLPNGHWLGPDYRGVVRERLSELHALLTASVMVRRTKAEVAQQLPAKIKVRIPVELPAAAARAIKQHMGALNALKAARSAAPGDRSIDMQWNRAVSEGCRLVGPAKVGGGMALIDTILERDDGTKLLVFGHHKEVLDAYATALGDRRLPVRFVRIDGDTTDAQRRVAIDSFQKDPQVRVCLLSIAVGGVGLTLTAATVAVFAELHWTPAAMQQAEDRLHRIGQTSSVTIYYITAAGTADDMMLASINFKHKNIGVALDGTPNAPLVPKQAGEAPKPALTPRNLAQAFEDA